MPAESTRVIALRAFYLCAYIAVGISTPYLSPYLRDLGFSGSQIAAVLSMAPIANLGAPLLWAWLADRTRRHDRVLRVTCLGSAFGMALFLLARQFRLVLAAYAVAVLFNVGISPVVDTLAVAASREGAGYGRIRMWGSFGFLLAAVGGGLLLTARGGRPADPLVPGLMFAGLFAAGLASFGIEGRGAATHPRLRLADVLALWRDRRFRLLLLVGPLHWMGLAPYNAFFGLFIRQRGLPPAVGGASFAVGVVAEGAVLFAFASFRRRAQMESLLALSFAATVLRWLLVWRAHAAGWVIALQALHGLSFGLFWIAGISLLNECVPGPLRATGQAIYLVAMLGLGNLVGYHATGLIFDAGQDIAPAFLAAGLLELLPLAIVLGAARRARAPAGAASSLPG